MSLQDTSNIKSDSDSNNALFGYGSLILPTSLVSRFVDIESSVDEIYENGLQYGDEDIVREEAQDAWEELKNELEILPVKVPGFKRTYTYESERGGTMLEATYTGEDSDYINGVLVIGLDDEYVDDIDSSEEAYDKIEVDSEDIEHYLDDKTIQNLDYDLPETVEIYVGSDDDRFNEETSSRKNKTYHGRILSGIDMLGDLYGEDVAEEFLKDFIDSTLEESLPGGQKVTVEEYERSLENYEELVEDLYEDNN